jgi:hypothetical protein
MLYKYFQNRESHIHHKAGLELEPSTIGSGILSKSLSAIIDPSNMTTSLPRWRVVLFSVAKMIVVLNQSAPCDSCFTQNHCKAITSDSYSNHSNGIVQSISFKPETSTL